MPNLVFAIPTYVYVRLVCFLKISPQLKHPASHERKVCQEMCEQFSPFPVQLRRGYLELPVDCNKRIPHSHAGVPQGPLRTLKCTNIHMLKNIRPKFGYPPCQSTTWISYFISWDYVKDLGKVSRLLKVLWEVIHHFLQGVIQWNNRIQTVSTRYSIETSAINKDQSVLT